MADLVEVLGRARALGFLGPGDLTRHLDQAAAMVTAADGPPRRFLDLGSGGGIPGLALLERWPESRAVLLDARRRRAAFLRRALDDLGLEGRAEVREGRAEDLARRPSLRAGMDLVVARSFASPAVTAECAAGFLEAGGLLLVAEPPEPEPRRWPPEGLAELGFVAESTLRTADFGVARLRLPAVAAERWPRRAPAKRPLWTSPQVRGPA